MTRPRAAACTPAAGGCSAGRWRVGAHLQQRCQGRLLSVLPGHDAGPERHGEGLHAGEPPVAREEALPELHQLPLLWGAVGEHCARMHGHRRGLRLGPGAGSCTGQRARDVGGEEATRCRAHVGEAAQRPEAGGRGLQPHAVWRANPARCAVLHVHDKRLVVQRQRRRGPQHVGDGHVALQASVGVMPAASRVPRRRARRAAAAYLER